MAEIIEEFFTGYCRNFDMTQTVICEFEQLPNGLHLLDSSCEYGDCKFSKDCTLMKQALDKEEHYGVISYYTENSREIYPRLSCYLNFIRPIHHIPESLLLLFF